MIYLLDSNVCIQYLRGRNALVRQRLAVKPLHEIRLCSVVKAELYIGVLRTTHPTANRSKIDTFVAPYTSLPFDDAAADVHAQIRRHLEALGISIGPHDLQIAAIALVHGCTLVSHNTREFSRVPGCCWKIGKCRERRRFIASGVKSGRYWIRTSDFHRVRTPFYHEIRCFLRGL